MAAWLLCAACALPAAWAQTPAAAPASAAASTDAPIRTVRAEFAAPLQAAQTLIGEGKAREALAKLVEAEAVPNRTPWETWVLERTRATAAQRAGDAPLIMKSLEAALATGQADPAEELPLIEAMVGSAARDRDHARVLRWSKRYEELNGANDTVRLMRIQSQAETGDLDSAKTAMLSRLAAADRTGRPLPEGQLRLLLNLQFRTKDKGSQATLERLVATTPRPEYWSDLVGDVARQPSISDRALLELYRLLRATGGLKGGDLRAEMANLALRAGQPGEAQVLMDEGYAAGELGTGAQAAEHAKLRDQVRRAAAADKADRSAAEAAARRAADGTALADLGFATVAALPSGSPPAAAEAGLAMIEQGVAKGGLKRPAEIRLHLAIAQMAAGRKEPAQQTLAELSKQPSNDPLAAPIRLWTIFAQGPAMLPSRQ